MEPREAINDLWDVLPPPLTQVGPDDEVIDVSAATKRIAFAYERFRNTLEPDEEDILRRNAIYRILERRLPEGRPAQVTAEQLLQELMRGNYIQPVSKRFAEHIASRLVRTELILSSLAPELHEWFLHVVAVVIDRDCFPRVKDEALVEIMYQDTYRRVEWVDNIVAEDKRPVQLFLACHRALFQADDFELTYHYFRRQFRAWDSDSFTESDAHKIAKDLPQFFTSMEEAIHHPSRDRLARLLKPAAVPYRVLRQMVTDPETKEALRDQEQLESLARSATNEKLSKMRGRMNKRAWNSILFLFLTKTILALLIELPYEVLLLQEFHALALTTNILFHPLLLFFLATTVRLPGSKNTDRIVEDLEKVVEGEIALPTIVMRPARQYGAVTWTGFAIIYVLLFLFLFWGLFSLLEVIGFSLVAMFMFVMFLGLVTFLAFRIRRSLSEMIILPASSGAISTLFGFLTLPVLEFGRWLAVHIQELNVALFFMDRVLEAPFKILIDVSEEWFSFVRERREEIA